MFIRIFTIADNAKLSKSIADKLLFPLEKHSLKRIYISNKQYWKFKEMFVLEIELTLKSKISVSFLNNFFLSISNKWDKFDQGDEVEILLSNTMNGCEFKHRDISMIDIFLKKSEFF